MSRQLLQQLAEVETKLDTRTQVVNSSCATVSLASTGRRRRKNSAGWLDWLRSHRAELSACGLPPPVLSSRLRWHVFLEHDGCDEVNWDERPGWTVRWLSAEQCRTLAGLIEREHGDTYPGVLRVLREVAGDRDR